jgi:histidine ammonia-lyase
MLNLTGEDLTIEDVVDVARAAKRVSLLSDLVRERLESGQAWVAAAVESGTVIYGVTTGFGSLATTGIPPEKARRLSRNLVLNCLAGVGEPLPPQIVRAMMLIRANSLAKGFSGIRPQVVEILIEMLNRGVTPYIPSKGSLGASGDLAPLAHMAVVLSKDPDMEDTFSGKAWFQGQLMEGAAAMAAAGLTPLVLEAKEGLALTNGITFMAAAGALALHDCLNLVDHAEVAAALSMEALLGISQALDPHLHQANGQPGQIRSAANLRNLLAGSQLIDSAPHKVQDAYSLRCTPQVLGPIRDVLAFLSARFQAAINAASDNPLIFLQGGGRSVSGGNFHGAGPAMWLDFLGIAIAEAGSISERRTFRMLDPALNGGLPAMLVHGGGLESGLMVPQYTAAALVSDNKTLAHPDSVDSIPSSANQEDHVSMGANAARHTLEIVDNLHRIIAIEMLTAAQAIDLRAQGPKRLGAGTRHAYDIIRQHVGFISHDRETSSLIERLVEVIQEKEILAAEAA